VQPHRSSQTLRFIIRQCELWSVPARVDCLDIHRDFDYFWPKRHSVATSSPPGSEAARLAGVRVNQIRIITSVEWSGGGLGGVIDTSRLLSAQSTGGGPN